MENKEIEIFKSDDGTTEIEVRIDKDTVWLNKYQISELFLTDRTSVGRHIGNIYKTNELNENATSAKKAHENSDLFGQEKNKSFQSSVATIYQAIDGIDVYPSIEEKAANLLYFITKNHSFSDGIKRIAAFFFLYFLERNGILFDKSDY